MHINIYVYIYTKQDTISNATMYTFDPDGVRHGPFVLIWIIFILNLFSYYQKNAVNISVCKTAFLWDALARIPHGRLGVTPSFIPPFHWAAIYGALWERHGAPCAALRSSKALIDHRLVSNWSPWSARSPSVDSLAQRSVAIRSESKQIATWSYRSYSKRQLISYIARYLIPSQKRQWKHHLS